MGAYAFRDAARVETVAASPAVTSTTSASEALLRACFELFHTTCTGLAKLSVKLRDGEAMFPYDDGVYVSAGAGVERFFWQSWAYDLSARYMTVFLGGKVNHDVHVALGLIFYAN